MVITDRSEREEDPKVRLYLIEQFMSCGQHCDDFASGVDFQGGRGLDGKEVHALNGFTDCPEPHHFRELGLNKQGTSHCASDFRPMTFNKAILGLAVGRNGS